MNKFYYIILLSLIMFRSHAFIYEIKARGKISQQKPTDLFIGCSDFHDKHHAANTTQLQKLEHNLQQWKQQPITVIIEDLSSINNSGRFACGRYFVNSRGGVLGGLAQTVRKMNPTLNSTAVHIDTPTIGSMGFEVDNIEFRFCRVTALGPVLNNLNTKLDTLASVAGTSLAALFLEIENTIQEIQAYNDGPELKKWYEQNIHAVRKTAQELHINNSTMSVADYLTKYSTAQNRLELLKKLLTFDSGLLDVKLVHSVVNAKTKKVLAFAGGAHINRACEMLETIGYTQKIKNTTVNFTKEHDLKRCLGSHIIDGAYCVKPEPISIDTIADLMAN